MRAILRLAPGRVARAVGDSFAADARRTAGYFRISDGFAPPPWSARDAIYAGLGSFAIAVAIGLAAAALGADIDSAGFGAGIRIVSYVLLGASVWLVGARWRGATWTELGLGAPMGGWSRFMTPIAQIFIGVIVVAGVGLALELWLDLGIVPQHRFDVVDSRIPDGIWGLVDIFSVICLAPLDEEIYFRGFLLPALLARMRLRWALWIQSVAFMLTHALNSGVDASALFLIALFGAGWGLLYLRSGSIWPCVATHAAMNCLTVGISEILAFMRP